MTKAEIVADSISTAGVRLTTFVLTYPRFIHSEFMTHRMISKNASSSRAIPVAKFMEAIKTNPAMPIAFSKNCKGMQAQEDIANQEDAQKIWLEARDAMIKYVEMLTEMGVHKQHANRLLEPFTHISVVATATDWANFFSLRCHKDAQPEFQELAKAMFKEYSENSPKVLKPGEWHLPFIKEDDLYELNNLFTFKDAPGPYSDMYSELLRQLIISSVARCARVSYNTHDGENSIQKDYELYLRLVGNSPIHASPTEHQAKATDDSTLRSGNLRGWLQYRKTLPNENILELSPTTNS